MKEQEIKAKVFSTFKDNGKIVDQKEEQIVLDVLRLQDGVVYANVSTDRKVTIGKPNYSSVSFSVFLSVPCVLEEGELDRAYSFVSKFCENKISALVKEVS